MIVVDLRYVGMTAWLSGVLKISIIILRYLLLLLLLYYIRTAVSCSAQSFSTPAGMLSGPAALRGLILDRVFQGWEVWAVFVQVCHSVFQTMNTCG